MKKLWFRALLLFLSVCILSAGYSTKAFAADEEYKTFSQLDPRWKDIPYYPGWTIGRAGCYICSFAVLIAYANPELRDVSKFNPEIFAHSMTFSSAGLGPMSEVSKFDPTFTWEAFADPGADVCATIKSYLDQGKFVIVRAGPPIAYSSTHFSPIVGWNDETNKPIIMDVCNGRNPTWEEWEPYVNRLDICSSSLCDSMDALNGDNVQSNAPETEEEKEELEEMIQEYDLTGMPDLSHLMDEAGNFELADQSSLSIDEMKTVSTIKQDIKNAKTNNHRNWYQVLTSFLGICSVMYGILLFFAYLFDYLNTFIEVSFLNIISLGRFKIYEEQDREDGVLGGYNKNDGYTYLTPTMLLKRMVLCFIVGFILLSGWVSTLTMKVFLFVSSHIS